MSTDGRGTAPAPSPDGHVALNLLRDRTGHYLPADQCDLSDDTTPSTRCCGIAAAVRVEHGAVDVVCAKHAAAAEERDSATVAWPCVHCGRLIAHVTLSLPGYLPLTGWADVHPRDPFYCPKALSMTHTPAERP